MKNLKIKIRTLLAALILTTLCSSLFITDISYAKPPKPPKPTKATEEQKTNLQNQLNQKIQEFKDNPEKLSDFIDETQEDINDLKKVSGPPDLKTIEDLENTVQQAQKLQTQIKTEQAEEECQYKYGTSCAQNKLDEDPNSLVEGTFSVTDNLKLDNGEQPKKYFNDNTGESPIVSFILTIINFATTIMGSFAVILFIIAGFMFMVSGGNSQKLDEAKDIVKYAAIGLIVAFMAYVITIFVQSIFSNG